MTTIATDEPVANVKPRPLQLCLAQTRAAKLTACETSVIAQTPFGIQHLDKVGRRWWNPSKLPSHAEVVTVWPSVDHRATVDDERILHEAARPGESTTETLRRALRLLDHDRWLEQFRADAEVLKDENLNAEPEIW